MDISGLFVANPVVSFQDEDLFYISVWDGVSAFTSGAFTYASLVEALPTLYTLNGALADERTVDMAGFNLAFNDGLTGFNWPTPSDIAALVHLRWNGERTTLGVGEFEGVEPLAETVFAFQDSAFMCLIPFGTDVSGASNYRWTLGFGTGNDDVNMNFYNANDLRIALNTATGGSLLQMYDSLGDIILNIGESTGEIEIGTITTPSAVTMWGQFAFNTATTVAQQTAGGAYTFTGGAGDLVVHQAIYDGLRAYGWFN